MTQQMQIRAIETDGGSKFSFDGTQLTIDGQPAVEVSEGDIEGLVWLLTGNKRRVPRASVLGQSRAREREAVPA